MNRTPCLLLALLAASGCDAVVGLGDYCVLDGVETAATAQCRRVWPQCGCAEGETCGVDGTCEPAGVIPFGGRCDPGATAGACAPGSDCLTFGAGATSHCHTFCDTEEDCAVMGPTSFCIGLVGREIGVCTVSCSPGRDEATCGPGLTCDVLSPDGTFCRPIGAGTRTDPCDQSDQACAAGLTCTLARAGERECFIACGPGFAPCPEGERCYEEDPSDRLMVSLAGPDDWGVCLPR